MHMSAIKPKSALTLLPISRSVFITSDGCPSLEVFKQGLFNLNRSVDVRILRGAKHSNGRCREENGDTKAPNL